MLYEYCTKDMNRVHCDSDSVLQSRIFTIKVFLVVTNIKTTFKLATYEC